MVGGWEWGCRGAGPRDLPRRPHVRPRSASLKPRPVGFGSGGVFVCARAHVACFVVVVVAVALVVVAVVAVFFVVVWAGDNRALTGWLLLSTLGSFQTSRQEILPKIAAVNWPIFLERE